MNTEQLIAASDVLAWLSQMANRLPEPDGVKMALTIQMALLYLLAFTKHVVEGEEPYDALVKASRGDTPLPQSPALEALQAMNVRINGRSA